MASYIRRSERESNTVALWARVSGSRQDTDNQLRELRAWVTETLGLKITREFIFTDSAWQDKNGKGQEFDQAREELLEGARLGQYRNVATWAVDRLSRRGPEDMLRLVRQLSDELGIKLFSYRDPWVQSLDDPFARPIILSVFATVAQFESQRRSDRVKAHITRVKAAGGTWGGRKPGSANKAKARDADGREHGTVSDQAKRNLRAAWTPERRAAASARMAERNRAKRA